MIWTRLLMTLIVFIERITDSATISCIRSFSTDFNESFDCKLKKGKLIIESDHSTRGIRMHCLKNGSLLFEDLTKIPQFKHTIYQIKSFDLTNCKIPDAPLLNLLMGLGVCDLQVLKLDNIQNLTQRHVIGLEGLKSLEICNIYTLEKGIFKTLSNLERVTFEKVSTHVLETSTFFSRNETIILNLLEISDCNIMELSNTFQGVSPRQFIIRDNPLGEIKNTSFEGLVFTEEIELKNNYLKSISKESFSSVPQLKSVLLWHNQLSELPTGLFMKLSHLEHFELVENPLILGEDLLANLPALRKVIIEDNFLTAIPSNLLRGSTEIRHLSFKSNSLQELPPDLLKDQVKLTFLDLSENMFYNLSPHMFGNLLKLEELYLADNYLYNLAVNATGPVTPYLVPDVDLDLVKNKDEEKSLKMGSPYSIFSRLSSLRVLSLIGNNITTVYRDWREDLLQLQNLDLSNNHFTLLTEADLRFQQNHSNMVVDFQGNQISTIEFLNEEFSGPELRFNDNLFDCDCHLYMFAHYLHRNRKKSDMRCSSPAHLAEQFIRNVSLEEFRCIRPEEECPSSCECRDTPASTTKVELHCKVVPSLSDLNLYQINDTKLRLTHTPPSTIDLPIIIRELNLSNLNLTETPILVHSNSLNLLDLSNNNLEYVPRGLLMSERLVLSISGNKISCDCDNVENIELLKLYQTKVKDFANITCGITRVMLKSLDTKLLCRGRNNMILGILIGFLGIFCITVVGLLYWFKRELMILSLSKCLCWVRENMLDKDKIYDAFISYVHSDKEFVVETLVPELELGSESYKLCLHYRDWKAGDWIPEQITRSIENSRRTIVVLSENSMASDWVRQEFRLAHESAKRDGVPRVIVILLSNISSVEKMDPELRAYLSTNTYLSWQEPWFWKKLRDALPQRNRRPHRHITCCCYR